METRELFRIGITTGIIHSIFWSTLTYTVNVFGIVDYGMPVYRVVLIGSFLWGLFGVATVIRRERDSIRIEIIDRLAEHYLGVDGASKEFMRATLNYCWFPFAECGKIEDNIMGKTSLV